jgi:ABC-type multidrug transport system ATPase subunit
MPQRRLSNEEWAAKSLEEVKKDHEKANGVHIDVSKLSYSVVIGKTTKNLLNNVSFSLEPGNLCALMGPSGAGKRSNNPMLF